MAKEILSDLDFKDAARPINLPAPTLSHHAATKAYVDTAVASGGSMVGEPVFVQDTEPVHPGPYVWFDISGGNLQIKYHDGV